MITQTVSDNDLIGIMSEQRRCKLCGVEGQDLIYGLKAALVIARRSAIAGRPASAIQIGRDVLGDLNGYHYRVVTTRGRLRCVQSHKEAPSPASGDSRHRATTY
jgi:hypothetical protein